MMIKLTDYNGMKVDLFVRSVEIWWGVRLDAIRLPLFFFFFFFLFFFFLFLFSAGYVTWGDIYLWVCCLGRPTWISSRVAATWRGFYPNSAIPVNWFHQSTTLASFITIQRKKKKRGKKRKEKRKQEEKKMATDLEEFFDVVVGLGRCFHEVGAPSFGLLLALSVRQFPRLGLIAFVAHQHQRHILQRTLFPSIVKPKLFRSHGRYTKLNLFIQSMHRAEEILSHFFFFQIHLFIFCLHHWIIFSRLMVQEKNLNKSFSFLFFSFFFLKMRND